jgi:hypothetical protein
MRKRLALVFASVAMLIAVALPATTAAATPGKFGFVSGYCSGHTVFATFRLTKYAGFYATKLTMTAQGQGFWNGGWHNEGRATTFTKYDYSYSKTVFTQKIKWNPGESGGHRIKVTAKILDGRSVIGRGSDTSGYCN